VNNPTLGEFCFTMIGRADIEGSKSDVAMNAWPPQASYPCGLNQFESPRFPEVFEAPIIVNDWKHTLRAYASTPPKRRVRARNYHLLKALSTDSLLCGAGFSSLLRCGTTTPAARVNEPTPTVNAKKSAKTPAFKFKQLK
jgi:hypothetical protein